jgi:peptide-methionine (S)-S-oxide reductase
MRLILIIIITALFFICCTPSQNKETAIPHADAMADTSKEAVAYFAEGCFWHTEIVFESLVGVRDAICGYAGGTSTNPNYEEVSSGNTGHAEAVEVHYDPLKISYETLLQAFFASHDPTTPNRAGNDEGTQYRSVAFYRNDAEKKTIEAEIKKITGEKRHTDRIITQVTPFTKFYPAEDYHQGYISRNPGNPYVQNVSIPDFNEFRKTFKGNFKQ